MSCDEGLVELPSKNRNADKFEGYWGSTTLLSSIAFFPADVAAAATKVTRNRTKKRINGLLLPFVQVTLSKVMLLVWFPNMLAEMAEQLQGLLQCRLDQVTEQELNQI